METSTARSRKTVTAGAGTLLAAWMGVVAGGLRWCQRDPRRRDGDPHRQHGLPQGLHVLHAPTSSGMNSEAGTDVASCESMTKSNYQNILATLQSSVNQKRAIYHVVQARHLPGDHPELGLRRAEHDQPPDGGPGVRLLHHAAGPVGGACSQDYECIGGWCNVPSTSTEWRRRVRGVPCAAGMSCAAAGGPSCGPNAVCDRKGPPILG